MLVNEFNPEDVKNYMENTFPIIKWTTEIRNDKTTLIDGSKDFVRFSLIIEKETDSDFMIVSLMIENDIIYNYDRFSIVNHTWRLDDLKKFISTYINLLTEINKNNLSYLNISVDRYLKNIIDKGCKC